MRDSDYPGRVRSLRQFATTLSRLSCIPREPSRFRSAAVRAVAAAFDQNHTRLQAVTNFHVSAMHLTRYYERARRIVATRFCDRPYLSPDEYEEFREQLWAEYQSPSGEPDVELADPLDHDRVLGRLYAQGLDDWIHSVFAALLTNAWAAFETLAGDLWTIAVNEAPGLLGPLAGDPLRIDRLADSKLNPSAHPSAATAAAAAVPHSAAGAGTQFTPDLPAGPNHLEGKMGERLVAGGHVRLNGLAGIREAYSRAFSRQPGDALSVAAAAAHTAIDRALADKGLDAAALTSDLLRRRAGVADADYAERINRVPAAVKLTPGEQLQLTWHPSSVLITAATIGGAKLLAAVDRWLTNANATARTAT